MSGFESSNPETRIQYFDSGLLTRLSRPVGRLHAELLRIFAHQPLPPELHRVAACNAAERLTGKKPVQHVEADVPARSPPRDETAIDVAPERQARPAFERLELPADIAVLEKPGSFGARHFCLDRVWIPHPGEIYRSKLPQIPIHLEGRPLAQMRRIGERL